MTTTARIPWLIRVPWLSRKQKRIDGYVSHIDLVPTVLDLLGQPVGEQLQGRSRAAVLRGEETLADNDVVIEWNGRGSHAETARTLVSCDGWKMSIYGEGPNELFDMNNDPCEFENLYSRPEHQGRVREFLGRLRRWQKETGDHFGRLRG